jgi:hypothetical protein
MDIEIIRRAWNSQQPPGPPDEELIQALLGADRKLGRALFWRDMRESIVAIIVAIFFIHGGSTIGRVWVGYAAGTLCCFIPVFLILDRHLRRDDRINATASTRIALECAVRRVDHQIWLLRNVIWWYLLPIIMVFVLVLGDAALSMPRSAWIDWIWDLIFFGTTAGAVAVVIGTWYINRVAANQLLPLRQEFQHALDDLDQPEETD